MTKQDFEAWLRHEGLEKPGFWFAVEQRDNMSANTDPHLHKAASPQGVWPGSFQR